MFIYGLELGDVKNIVCAPCQFLNFQLHLELILFMQLNRQKGASLHIYHLDDLKNQ